MILDQFRLDHRVAMVTGANRGIGAALAVALAEAGADVALLGRSEPSETKPRIEGLGRRATWVDTDLATAAPADLGAAVATVRDEFGRLDILVNNAGIIRRADALELPGDDWDEVIAINLKTAFHLAQAAGRHMLAQGSAVRSSTSPRCSGSRAASASRPTPPPRAVSGLTRALANEWAAQRHQRQRDRAGLHRDRQHRRAARRPGPNSRHRGTHSGRSMGYSRRIERGGGVPRLDAARIRARRGPGRRRRMAGPVVSRRFDFLPWLFAEQATAEERERQAQWQRDLLAQGVREIGDGSYSSLVSYHRQKNGSAGDCSPCCRCRTPFTTKR